MLAVDESGRESNLVFKKYQGGKKNNSLLILLVINTVEEKIPRRIPVTQGISPLANGT